MSRLKILRVSEAAGVSRWVGLFFKVVTEHVGRMTCGLACMLQKGWGQVWCPV